MKIIRDIRRDTRERIAREIEALPGTAGAGAAKVLEASKVWLRRDDVLRVVKGEA